MASRPKRNMSEDLERLIKSIGDCKSKSEEDRIVHRAIEATKAAVKKGNVEKNRTRDFLVKLIYFEMLGHDSSFGHFLAVQACGSNSVMTKLVGYLAVTQFLESSDSLILLLVNTWRSDLQNENHVIVCSALTAICKLVNADAVGALVSQVVALLSHPKEIVRKKAVMAIHRFIQIDPHGEGGMAGVDIKTLLGNALCDPDPAVMSASLCGLYEMVKIDPIPFRALIPSLTSIIKQVTSHRLSKSYEYHHCPAPFIQIRLLRVLALLGAGDKPSTDNMKNILLSVLRSANPRNTIGYAVLFECIRTLTTVSPDTQLLEEAARSIFTFLRSDNSHNLKYMGMDALGGIVRINFRQAQEHQTAVMDCLEDPDDTLKLKTLELLYKMTKSTNVEIVVDKLIQYLQSSNDAHIQNNICQKVTELAEKYAPDTLWYVETMIEMFEAAGDAAPKDSEQNLLKLMTEQDTELQKSVAQLCLKLISKPKLPKILLYVVCWILGEYGSLLMQIPEKKTSLNEVQEAICELIQFSKNDEVVQGYILTALAKLSAKNHGSLPLDSQELLKKLVSSRSTDLQQRALEMRTLVQESAPLLSKVLPSGGASEEMELFFPQIESLSFLDGYIQQALDNGASAYVPQDERDEYDVSLTLGENAAAMGSTVSGGLKYNAYDTPKVPQPVPKESVSEMIMSEPEPVLSEMPTVDLSPAVMVAARVQETQKPSLTLPAVKSRRWGPVSTPQETQMEPPVIHISSGKLQYTAAQPTQNPAVPTQDRGVESTAVKNVKSDRDFLTASLFGGSQSTITSRSNGRLQDRVRRKEMDQKSKSMSVALEKPALIPDLDLLDLSDPNDAGTSSVNKPVDLMSDPFADLSFSNGANGSSTSAPVTPPAPALDLDALYGMQGTSMMNSFAPQAVNPKQPFSLGMGIMNGTGTSMTGGSGMSGQQVKPELKKQSQKDDPFKDLL